LIIIVGLLLYCLDACYSNPGALKNTINVGATNITDRRPDFSNFGECVDIFAPGVDINSSCSQGTQGCSGDDELVLNTGTSMACPHVSGALATYLQQFPTASTTEIIDHMTCLGVQNELDLNEKYYYLESQQSPNLLLQTASPFDTTLQSGCSVNRTEYCPNDLMPFTYTLLDGFGDGWDNAWF